MSLYINSVEQTPPVRKFTSHPSPSPEWEGITVTHREEEKTDVQICVQNSGGDYEWIKIGEST